MSEGETPQSWEEAVNWVTIPGHPLQLQLSARGWRDAMERIRQIDDNLAALIEKVRGSFAGAGATALIEHLNKNREALAKIIGEHERIPAALDRCASHLSEAIRKIAIPDWVKQQVLDKQAEYERTGRFVRFETDEFWRQAPDGITYAMWRHGYAAIWSYAETNLNTLANDYGQVARGLMPAGTAVQAPGVGTASTSRPPGGPGGRVGDTPLSPTGVSPASLPTGLNPGAGLNTAGLPTTSLDPPGLGTSGLDPAGVGSGLGDLGLGGGGGSGSLAGLGGGLGGADALGAGRLGPLISAEAMTGAQSGAGMTGAASAAGRLGGATAGGLAGTSTGAMGGVLPAGGAGLTPDTAGGEHKIQLVELDKSFFGPRDEDKERPTDVIG